MAKSGRGDHLYGLVDLNQYLRAIPTFTLGDSFHVVNGKVAGLPGMLFSTTAPAYNPNNLDIGFDGTPFTGDATAFTMHQLASVPEPNAPLVALAGAIALAGLMRRRQTKSRPA